MTCPICGRTDGLFGAGLRQCWHCAPSRPVVDAHRAACSTCRAAGGFYGAERLCWVCWVTRSGLRPIPARESAKGASPKLVAQVVERFTRALGEPVCTPEWIADGNGGLERAKYRVWRWDCPLCRSGERDPDRIYRPFAIASDGEAWCDSCEASAAEVRREIQIALDVRELHRGLEATA